MEITCNLANPNQTLEVANILQKFVKERRLTANIQGKDYPLVEAWTFAGSQFGLFPIVKQVENQSTGDEIKYLAEVEVINYATGQVVGRGFAVCSNREHSKKRFDEYAIMSMAQTRATGKAFRIPLGWLMKASGFEATPAEEMDFARDELDDDQRDFLNNLLESSTYDERIREKLRMRIGAFRSHAEYEKAKADLLANQLGIDGVINPNQTDINKHLKKLK